jgi:hypothetical protein
VTSNSALRKALKDHLNIETGIKRDETVDFIWNALASKNIKLDMDNKDRVFKEGVT